MMQTSNADSNLGHLLAGGDEDEQFGAATRAPPLQGLHPAQKGGSHPPRSPAPAAGTAATAHSSGWRRRE
jgi:hypothetical protein